MKTPPIPLPQRREQLRSLTTRLQRGHARELDRLDALLGDQEAVQSLNDDDLCSLILVVKHRRPDLALSLLPHVRATRQRISLESCLASIWGRIDINAAWKAISTSRLPASERLAMHSAMV